jgi:hypothetical protein
MCTILAAAGAPLDIAGFPMLLEVQREAWVIGYLSACTQVNVELAAKGVGEIPLRPFPPGQCEPCSAAWRKHVTRAGSAGAAS